MTIVLVTSKAIPKDGFFSGKTVYISNAARALLLLNIMENNSFVNDLINYLSLFCDIVRV